MAESIYRLPGNEQYSYVEVKFADGELVDTSVLTEALDNLNSTFPKATSQGGNSQNSGGAQSPQGGGENVPSCQHGQRVVRTGTSGKGPWKAYMCPSKDRAQQCKPIDAKTGREWG